MRKSAPRALRAPSPVTCANGDAMIAWSPCCKEMLDCPHQLAGRRDRHRQELGGARHPRQEASSPRPVYRGELCRASREPAGESHERRLWTQGSLLWICLDTDALEFAPIVTGRLPYTYLLQSPRIEPARDFQNALIFDTLASTHTPLGASTSCVLTYARVSAGFDNP
jgi:hypothetical protein